MPTIVVFGPHNDDHALALGGTIAQYRKRGYDVVTYIGSFGELSHPHLKPEVIRKARVREAQRADRALGGTGRVHFLGLREFKFAEDFKRKKLGAQLRKRLEELAPEKLFVTAANDLHKDHQVFHGLIRPLAPRGTEVYAYYVYPHIKLPVKPRLFVDVTNVYRKKLAALHLFRSQINLFGYTWSNNLVYAYHLAKNLVQGLLNGTTLAETAYKL